MGRELDVFALGATRIVVGLSALVQIGPVDSQLSLTLKKISGNTIEIVPRPLALSGTSCVGWGIGYVLGDTEAVSVSGPATYWLAATGATVTLGCILGYGQGTTLATRF